MDIPNPLFYRHIKETQLEFFSVWLVCHVFREFLLLNKRQRERERERERQTDRERGRERERVRGERERGRGRERERERKRGRRRGRERESRVRRVGGREGERERERERADGRRKMLKKNLITYQLAQVVFTPNAWLPSLKASTRVLRVCSDSLALACLITLTCRTKLSTYVKHTTRRKSPSNAVRSSCAYGDHCAHHRPCNKDVLQPWLDSWLSIASQSRQFSSAAHAISKDDFVTLASDADRRSCNPKFSSSIFKAISAFHVEAMA